MEKGLFLQPEQLPDPCRCATAQTCQQKACQNGNLTASHVISGKRGRKYLKIFSSKYLFFLDNVVS